MCYLFPNSYPIQWRIQEFPGRGGGANFQSGCGNLIFYNFFCRKQHKNERIWITSSFSLGGGGAFLLPPWIRQCNTLHKQGRLPVGRGVSTRGGEGVAPRYKIARISQKLHEIKKILGGWGWGGGGGCVAEEEPPWIRH